MRFNENIRNLRKEKDYSQEYLAEKLGVTRQTISKWENGAAMPDLKKLTEIADFFCVSMDTLLGTEPNNSDNTSDTEKISNTDKAADSNDNENNFNTEYHKQYANRLFSIAYQNQQIQNAANHKALKTTAIILSIAIACVIFGLVSLFNSVDSKINNMQNQINMLSSQINTNNDYSYYEDEEFEYKFMSADNSEPYMINTKFTYAPSTYPKNAVVYISINNTDGTSQRIDLQEENGIFTATAPIDVTIVKNGYAYIDDGEVITREQIIYDKMYSDYLLYLNCSFDFNCSAYSDKVNYIIVLSEIGLTSYLKDFEIEDARIVAEVNDTEIYNEQVKFQEDKNWSDDCEDAQHYIFNVPSFTTDGTESVGVVYLKIVDSNGVIYKFYANLFISDSNGGYYAGINNEDYDDYTTEIIFAENKILH